VINEKFMVIDLVNNKARSKPGFVANKG